MPTGGLRAQLKGATQLSPTNRLTIATWLRPTGDRPTISSDTTLEVRTWTSRCYSSIETARDSTEVQEVMCNITSVLRPEIGCKVTVTTDVDTAHAGGRSLA